jgi:hypothetical protein
MSVKIRFVPNQSGIAEIGRSPELVQAMDELGNMVADIVRAIGPVDEDSDAHYVDQISVDSGIGSNDTAATVISANKEEDGRPIAAYIEFGTIDTPTFAPLRTAVEMMGLPFAETGDYR